MPGPRKPLLFLEPINGIGNRIYLLNAGLALTESTGVPLRILWFQDTTLGCRLDQLFALPPELQDVRQFRLGILNRPIRKILRRYMAATCSFYAGPPDLKQWMAEGFDFARLSVQGRSYLWGYDEFVANPNGYRQFIPIPSLLRIIQSYAIDADTVGVHIRRGDHKNAEYFSPSERFEQAMDGEIRLNPRTRFFLATDSPEEEARFRDRYPGRILVHRKRSLDRNSAAGCQDGLIDLYCLSNCRKLIGTCNSAFSLLAWKFRNIEHVIVTRG